MSYSFSDLIKVVLRVPRRCLALPFLLAVIICLTTTAGAAEKLIVGDKMLSYCRSRYLVMRSVSNPERTILLSYTMPVGMKLRSTPVFNMWHTPFTGMVLI